MKKLIFSFVLVLAIGFSLFKAYDIASDKIPKVIDTEYVQSKIDIGLAKKSSGEKYKIKYQVNKLDVVIDDNLYLKFDMNLDGYGKKGHIKGHVTGQPSFKSGAFYFKPTQDIVFDEFDLSGKIDNKGLLGKIIMKSEFVKNVISDDKIIKQATEKVINFYLNSLPVYKLKDDIKGKIISTTLTKLEVKDGQIKFELSFSKLIFSAVLFFILSIVLIGFLILVFKTGEGEILLFGLLLS